MADTLNQTGIGSADWAGGKAPPGGSHTGTATITMADGASFVVAHNLAEVQRKWLAGAVPSNPGGWVAFDQPSSPVPVVLNANLIASVK